MKNILKYNNFVNEQIDHLKEIDPYGEDDWSEQIYGFKVLKIDEPHIDNPKERVLYYFATYKDPNSDILYVLAIGDIFKNGYAFKYFEIGHLNWPLKSTNEEEKNNIYNDSLELTCFQINSSEIRGEFNSDWKNYKLSELTNILNIDKSEMNL